MTELTGRGVGFTSPPTDRRFSIRRTGIELVATVGLAVALVIAATAVSIGMARAQTFGGAVHHSGAPFVVAVGLSVMMAGWGGLSALVARDTTLPPRG